MKKGFCVCLCLLLMAGIVGCGVKEPERSPGDIRWPKTELVSRLPVPKSLQGEVLWESAEDYSVDLTEVSQEQFDDYVDACMDNGFTEDYYRDSSDYWAYDVEGYYLSVDYDSEERIMNISIDCPDEEEDKGETDIPIGTTTTTTKATTTKKTTTTTSTKKQDGGLSADFKAAMDSYEEFMNEYVAFMKRYADNPTDLGLLVDYARYMSDYAEFCKSFEEWEDEDLNAAELAYYLDVQTRVNKKLLEVAG